MSLIDQIGQERAHELMAEATRKAAAEADALGLPHVVIEDGRAYREYPDGRREPIEESPT